MSEQHATDASRDLDLLVVGDLNPDILVIDRDPVPVFGQVEKLVSGIRMTIGGSAAIMACGAARLGLSVAFCGMVGDDQLGHAMLGALAGRGVDTSACPIDSAIPTGATVILTRGSDRAILTATGTIDHLATSDVPRVLLSRARHLHVGSTSIQPELRAGLPGLFRDAHDAGATVSFDTNWDPTEHWDGVDELLPLADIFFPNLEEARRISGLQEPEAAARELVRRASAGRERGRSDLTPAIKLGQDGAIALSDGRFVRVAAPRVAVVDATGAGDSFDAGFVAAWISGWPTDEALALAVGCGSASTRGLGGVDAQPTLDEALALMR